MKKSVKALSMLCGAILLVSPINATIFAENTPKDTQANIVKTEGKKQVELKTNNEEADVNKNDQIDTNKNSQKIENNINKEYTSNRQETDKVKEEANTTEQNTNKVENVTTEVKKQLTQEEAKQMLVNRNPNVEYIYQGDENTFECLKEKNLSGYVFLPNEEGDMGFLVDRNTSNIYYFHPSGYVEQVK